MKTRFLRVVALGTALSSLALCTGCEEDFAQAEVPVTTAPAVIPLDAVETLSPVLPVAEAVPAAPTPTATDSVSPVLTPDTNGAQGYVLQPATPPEEIASTPQLKEVIKLVQSGVSEQVILTYIKSVPQPFGVGSDQIVYLNDLGISSTIMTALIEHDGSPAVQSQKQPAEAAKPAEPAVAVNPPGVTNYPGGTEPATTPAASGLPLGYQEGPAVTTYAPAPMAAAPAVTALPAETPTSVNYFYNYLSPYGNWVYVEGYGNCWQPTVAVVNPAWRPYGDNGRWLWTDAGWYWNSDYSWGWAPFHYGRWCHRPYWGWVWAPDVHWGPAWVSWRYTDTYCGWAPLGVGVSFYDSSFWFSYGLWIPTRYFGHHHPYHYYAHDRHECERLYHNSHESHHGVTYDHVRTAMRSDPPKAVIRDVPLKTQPTARHEYVQNRNGGLVVERPVLPKTVPPQTMPHLPKQVLPVAGRSSLPHAGTSVTAPQPGNPVRLPTAKAPQSAPNPVTVSAPKAAAPATQVAPSVSPQSRPTIASLSTPAGSKPTVIPEQKNGTVTQPKTAPVATTKPTLPSVSAAPAQQPQRTYIPPSETRLATMLNQQNSPTRTVAPTPRAPQAPPATTQAPVRNAPSLPNANTRTFAPSYSTPSVPSSTLRSSPALSAPSTTSPRSIPGANNSRSYSPPVSRSYAPPVPSSSVAPPRSYAPAPDMPPRSYNAAPSVATPRPSYTPPPSMSSPRSSYTAPSIPRSSYSAPSAPSSRSYTPAPSVSSPRSYSPSVAPQSRPSVSGSSSGNSGRSMPSVGRGDR